MEKRILIELSEGTIQNIVSTEPVEIIIVDWDNIDCGEEPIFKSEPEHIRKAGTFYELFDVNDLHSKEVRDELKRLHI